MLSLSNVIFIHITKHTIKYQLNISKLLGYLSYTIKIFFRS